MSTIEVGKLALGCGLFETRVVDGKAQIAVQSSRLEVRTATITTGQLEQVITMLVQLHGVLTDVAFLPWPGADDEPAKVVQLRDYSRGGA